MKYLVITLLLFSNTLLFSQDITAKQLLHKAIAYHDPNDTWKTFKDEFTVVLTTPSVKSAYMMESRANRILTGES